MFSQEFIFIQLLKLLDLLSDKLIDEMDYPLHYMKRIDYRRCIRKVFIHVLNVRIVHVRDEIFHFAPFLDRDGSKVRLSVLLLATHQNIDRISCIKILNDQGVI